MSKGITVNSVIITFFATTSALLVSSMAAYAFSRMSFAGNRALLIFVFIIRILLLIPIYNLVQKLDFLTERMNMVIVFIGICVPFGIWLIKCFLDDVPVELEEAACIDGSGPFRTYFRVVMPLIKPALVAVMILFVRVCWNDYVLSSILTGVHSRTVTVMVATCIRDDGNVWGLLTAMGTIVALPIILLCLFVGKDMVAGISVGGVKD